MKIYIIGSGGLGGFFGAMMAKSGLDVHFLARGAHYEAMKSKGLQIRSVAEGNFTIFPTKLIKDVSQIKDPDLIIYAVKTYSNEGLVPAIKNQLKPDTHFLTFQNGIESDLEIAKLSGHHRVYPGIAYIISTRTGPGVIDQTGGPRKLLFGLRNQQSSTELEKIAKLFQKAGIDATYVNSGIEKTLWEKFIFINAFSGFTAAYRKNIGVLRKDSLIMDLYRTCLEETRNLAQKTGVAIEPSIVDRYFKFTESLEEEANSSLYHDIVAGGPNELEALNGTVSRLGKNLGVDTPVNQMLYTLTKYSS